MWQLTTCKISVSLSFLNWNDFYRISELMSAILIQGYDKKNHFIFDPVQKKERQTEILQAVRYHILWSYYYYISIYQALLG